MVCRRGSSGKNSQESQRWASEKNKKKKTDPQCEPKHVKDRIVFMSWDPTNPTDLGTIAENMMMNFTDSD